MIILAIDSATPIASVALSIKGKEFQIESDAKRAHADQLLPMVDQLLSAHELNLDSIDGFALGRGPGGFTGLRVAAAVVQGLAYSVNKPVASVSTLAAFAQQGLDHFKSHENIRVCTDARKEQVYTAFYVKDPSGAARLEGSEQVLDPAKVQHCEIGIGDGFDVYPQLQNRVSTYICGQSSARWIAKIAARGWVDFEPAYRACPVYVRDNVTHQV